MSTSQIRLAEKISRGSQISPVDITRTLRTLSKQLEVRWKIVSEDPWLTISLDGEDREVFVELLKRKVAFPPSTLEDVRRWDIFQGYIQSKEVGFGVFVDVGLASKDALYPLYSIRSQLAEGKQIPVRQLASEYCLKAGVPVEVQIVQKTDDRLDVQLSDKWRRMMLDWKAQKIDRILGLGVSQARLEMAITKTAVRRYIRGLDALTLFNHVVVCRKGTEGPGIIARLGRLLRNVPLHLFSS